MFKRWPIAPGGPVRYERTGLPATLGLNDVARRRDRVARYLAKLAESLLPGQGPQAMRPDLGHMGNLGQAGQQGFALFLFRVLPV